MEEEEEEEEEEEDIDELHKAHQLNDQDPDDPDHAPLEMTPVRGKKRERRKKGTAAAAGGGAEHGEKRTAQQGGCEAAKAGGSFPRRKKQRSGKSEKPSSPDLAALAQRVAREKNNSGEYVPGARWNLVRSNVRAGCQTRGVDVAPQEPRLAYRPSDEREFGQGCLMGYHHIDADCLAGGGCPLFTKKSEFGWTVQNPPPRMGENREARAAAIQKARLEAQAAGAGAARIRATRAST